MTGGALYRGSMIDRIRRWSTRDWSGRDLATIALLAAAVFLGLLILNRLGLTDPVDLRLARTVQTHYITRLGRIAAMSAFAGDVVVTGVIASGLVLLLLTWGRGLRALAPLAIVVVSVIELIGKGPLRYQPSPDEYVRAATEILATGETALVVQSFPSGHVARVAFLAVMISTLVPNLAIRVTLWVPVGATMRAQVYVGAHYPSDTVGGLALGIACGTAVVPWLRAGRG